MYLFLERGEGRDKERERNIDVWLPFRHPLLGTWPATQACALTGDRTSDPLGHRLALNPLSHTSQGPGCYFQGHKQLQVVEHQWSRLGSPEVGTLSLWAWAQHQHSFHPEEDKRPPHAQQVLASVGLGEGISSVSTRTHLLPAAQTQENVTAGPKWGTVHV